MVDVGAIRFKTELDLGSLDGQIRALQSRLSGKKLSLDFEPPKIDGFAREFEAALKRQSAETKKLEREFAKTAVAVERLSNAAKAATFRQQEREAAALARELAKSEAAAQRAAERAKQISLQKQEREADAFAKNFNRAADAAQRAAERTQQISLRKQQQEADAFAKSFNQAAEASARLNRQQQADKVRVAGANFNPKEVEAVRRAVQAVSVENKKAADTAALLRSQYGLTETEISKVVGKLNQAKRGNNDLAGTLANFGTNLIARYLSVQVAIDAVQASVRALVGVFGEASGEFRKFEASLLSFQAKSQGVEVDLAGLKEEVESVAKQTSFTPATLGDAATQLVSLGVDPTEVEGRLKSIAQAADVLKEDPVITGRVFQAGLTAYEKYGETAESVADSIVQAINSTPIGARAGITELEQLLSKAATNAAELGITFNELLTLDALFASTGARPEARATATETLLTRIISQKDVLEKEGVTIAIKENGGVDIEGTLRNVKTRLEEIPDRAGQLNLVKSFLGESAGNDLLQAIANIDTKYTELEASVNKSNGALERGFGIVSTGTDFQAGITEGLVATSLTQLGEVINPIEKAFISLQQQIIGTANVDLSPLEGAVNSLAAALTGNPLLVETLSEAFGKLAQDGIDALGGIIEGITVLVSNDDAIEQVGQGIEAIGGALKSAGLAASFALAIVDAISSINAVLLDTPILGDALRGALEKPLRPFAGLLQGSLKGINDVLVDLRDFAAGIFGPGFVTVLEGVADVARSVGDALAEIPNIGAPIDAFLDRVAERINKLAQQLANLLSKLPGGGGVASTAFEDSGTAPVPDQPNALRAASTTAFEALTGFATPDPETQQKPNFTITQEGLDAAGQLKSLREEQKNALADIDQRSAQARTRIANLDEPEREIATRTAREERISLQERLTNREKFLEDLKTLANRPGISVKDATAVETEIAATEKTIADERLAIAQNLRSERVRTREEELRLFEEEKAIAESRLQLTQQGQTNEVLGQQASGQIDAEQAADRIADIQQNSTRQTIALKEEEIAEVRRLEASKVLEAEDAAARIRGLQVDLAQLNGQLIQGEIEDQERGRAAVIKRLDEELRGIQLIQEARQIESDLVVQALSNQQNLFQANLSLAQTQAQLEQTRLQGVLSNAEAENNITGAIAARGNILEAQVQAVVQELAGKEASFAISERQQRLDAQRAIQVAEVAAIEAQITLEKAKQSEDSTPEEISGLQQIADLRAAQVDSARDTAAIQDSVLAAQKEELSVQGQLTIEQLRQNKLEESRNKLIDARRGIISALAAESNTSVDDSLASLERVQDRLKEAQRAGLFQGEGGNIREASRDVRRALNSSNSDRAILKLLQEQGNNPEVAALVDAIGRSDLTGLVEASKNFKEATLEFDKSLEVFGATGESVAALRDESIQAAVDSLGINFDPRTTDASILGIQNDPLAAVGAIDNLNEELSRLRPDSSRAQDIEGRIQALQLQNSDLAIVEIADTVRQIKDFTSIIAGNSGRESIGNLTVMTPDPVADTSKIVGDVAAMTTQEVNV
jgi:TP901 family phage tail tape measure protein